MFLSGEIWKVVWRPLLTTWPWNFYFVVGKIFTMDNRDPFHQIEKTDQATQWNARCNNLIKTPYSA